MNGESGKMEAIEVTARFEPDGKITPLSFTWKGNQYPIDTIGRRWEDSEAQHILVMAPVERVFELVFFPALGRWYMGEYGNQRMVA